MPTNLNHYKAEKKAESTGLPAILFLEFQGNLLFENLRRVKMKVFKVKTSWSTKWVACVDEEQAYTCITGETLKEGDSFNVGDLEIGEIKEFEFEDEMWEIEAVEMTKEEFRNLEEHEGW